MIQLRLVPFVLVVPFLNPNIVSHTLLLDVKDWTCERPSPPEIGILRWKEWNLTRKWKPVDHSNRLIFRHQWS
jgi:hypothetical protein